MFKNKLATKDKLLKINSSKKHISNIAGQKSKNISYFRKKYKFKDINLYSDDVDINEFVISIGNLCDKINIRNEMKNYLKENKLLTN